jgi:N-acetylneuraminic acid mutarotase
MKGKSTARLASIVFVIQVFLFCRSLSVGQELTVIKDKEMITPKGTLQISGNLEMLPLATMNCNVTPTSCDNVAVSGGAMLDGQLIVNMIGTYAHSSRRTLLEAREGLHGSVFSFVKINYPSDQSLKARITYDANHMYLEIAFGSEGFPLLLPTQTAQETELTPPAISDVEAQQVVFRPTVAGLSFAERVAYQYAIEEVYWRHRIWPKDNPQPKPPLDAVISREQVERKVEDYLRKSQIVANLRGSGISACELQAEIDRMASHTHQPDVLRELFAALNNDPFVIAECLARPHLADQLVNGLPSHNVKGASSAAGAGVLYTSAPTTRYRLPQISITDNRTNDTWTATTIMNAPAARETHAVWTGSEMIIWGGSNFTSLNTGSRYNPATDSWMATSTSNAPTGRGSYTLVWTGSEMIVWGGIDSGGDTNTGSRYNPTTDVWVATSLSGAPSPRDSHTAVWTGTEMIIWAGNGGCGSQCNLNNGGKYNPITDSWTATSWVNAPAARWSHRAVWTGSEMIVWGGTDSVNYLQTGGRYNATTDTWVPTSLVNVPIGRDYYTAVWTASEMIVWGGVDETFNDTNTGGRYNPSTDSWVATNTNNAPSPRDSHIAVWTGTEMIIWGGGDPTGQLNTGARYNTATGVWTPTTTTNPPEARENHTVVWTGGQMIVWGGRNSNDPQFFLNTGGIYCAQTPVPTVQSVVSQKTHGFVGDFDVPLPLDGTPGIECRSGGGTNDYTMVITFSSTITVNGNPQAVVTGGTGTIGSNGVSNGGVVQVSGNIVTIPLTNVANAQTIQVTLYGVNGSTNFTIPMRILIGDTNGNGTVNASDVSQTKSRVGQQISSSNFRSDVNANGYIDAADIAMIKAALGTSLP